MIHVVNYLKNFKYCHLLPNTYYLSMFLLTRELFLFNSDIHGINTQYNQNLHMPSTKLTMLQKGVLFSGSRIYNCLPSRIKALPSDAKRFKSTLKRYLLEHVFLQFGGIFSILMITILILFLLQGSYLFCILYNFTLLFIWFIFFIVPSIDINFVI